MATPKNQSVQKAFALLRSFRRPEEWVTNAELSRRAGLSEACAHRLMKTLEELGAVVRDRRGCYRPGMVLATLSKDVAIGDLIRATSEDVLNDLAAKLKGVVHVGVLENGMVSYAAKLGETAGVAIPSRVGARQEAYCSALGKVLLAGLPAVQLEDFLHDGDFIALTPVPIIAKLCVGMSSFLSFGQSPYTRCTAASIEYLVPIFITKLPAFVKSCATFFANKNAVNKVPANV